MSLLKALLSSRMRNLNALSMLFEAVKAFTSGRRGLAALFVGGALVARQSSRLGFVAQLLLQSYKQRR